METEKTTENVTADVNSGEETTNSGDVVSIPKTDYEKLNQTLGSLKRELKDLKKSKEETVSDRKETSTTKQDDNRLLERLEKMSLRQANITHQDDIELARQTAKKWGVDIDEVIADDDFKVKLERQQTSRDNAIATTNIRGGAGTSQAKNTPEYWIAKGTPPTATDVPDRKTRATIARALMANTKSGKKFYND